MNDNIATVMLMFGISVFLYGCLCMAKCYDNYTKLREELPFVEEKGASTAVDVTAHMYQMQIPRYRRPSSPKDSSPV